MNIYQAIMKAADHIEANPSLYDFSCSRPECGSPGCMLGWIGVYLGMPDDTINVEVSTALGLEQWTGIFYHRVDELSGGNCQYVLDARVAAKGMRLYAEKYHGHEKPQQRPTSDLVADLKARIGTQTIGTGAVSEELTWA